MCEWAFPLLLRVTLGSPFFNYPRQHGLLLYMLVVVVIESMSTELRVTRDLLHTHTQTAAVDVAEPARPHPQGAELVSAWLI